jgi:hypothetical protein
MKKAVMLNLTIPMIESLQNQENRGKSGSSCCCQIWDKGQPLLIYSGRQKVPNNKEEGL